MLFRNSEMYNILDGVGIYKHNEQQNRFNVHLADTTIEHITSQNDRSFSFGLKPFSMDGTVVSINNDHLRLILINGQINAVCDNLIFPFELNIANGEFHTVLIERMAENYVIEISRLVKN